jgi:hypothetical protein
MLLRTRDAVTRLSALTSEIADRLQRLESLAPISACAAPIIGAAIEQFAETMRAPLSRGRAGGLARARQAAALQERWPDGRYMSRWDSEEMDRQIAERNYMRYAAGGFARASTASRFLDGTFAPTDSHGTK